MLAGSPIAKRVCPLFAVSPNALDKTASNCGSCLYYNLVYDNTTTRSCNIHASLLAWIEAQNVQEAPTE